MTDDRVYREYEEAIRFEELTHTRTARTAGRWIWKAITSSLLSPLMTHYRPN